MNSQYKVAVGFLLGSIVLFTAALQADEPAGSEAWYYNGERVSPADSRAVLMPYRQPAGVNRKGFMFPKLGKWDWSKRQQAHLALRAAPVPVVPVVPDSGAAAGSAQHTPSAGFVPPKAAQGRALPFWPDIAAK